MHVQAQLRLKKDEVQKLGAEAKYDGGGNLRDWWTSDDARNFETHTVRGPPAFSGEEAH